MFRKRGGSHPEFFSAEAAGLRWLAAGGAPVARVLDVGSDFIELERVPPGRASVPAARKLGGALARMHSAGVDGEEFGCPPADYNGQLFIGKRPMSSKRHANWGAFYVAERVLPFAEIAVAAGSVSTAEFADVERAGAVVAGGAFDDAEPPSRIHGDLWNGNVLWSPDGAVLIDPAAHGGHRETDLAMLDLFGCPHLSEVVAGYESVHPLRAGWESRVPLHQLHPLAVHAAGYGRSYGAALHRAALAVLRLRPP
ncbi:MAG TPA: fructosamine kinase family protein [Aldersonia sp.]